MRLCVERRQQIVARDPAQQSHVAEQMLQRRVG